MKITDTNELRIKKIIEANPKLKRSDFSYEININKLNQFKFEFELTQEAKNLLISAIRELKLSCKQLERIEKIVTGIINLEESDICEAMHIAEAIQYVYNAKL